MKTDRQTERPTNDPIFKCHTILKPQKVKKFEKFPNCQTIRKVTAHVRGNGDKIINLPWPNVKKLNYTWKKIIKQLKIILKKRLKSYILIHVSYRNNKFLLIKK